jgi:energy-coupling factor transporter ATP-binding protein EcfA2
MIRRITLQNYMSHAHTIIEPAAGLTVLVGPNNCGKSAVVSALETLCNNASGAYMVRHDEKEARVTVETDDGHSFVWKRRGNTVSYIIDETEIHRLGRDVPEGLHKLLRLPKVDAGENGEPFDIHIGAQKSPIFLLNEPGSRAAVFFASSSDATILLEMQKRHRNKVKERKNDEKRLKAEIQRLDAELAVLEPLTSLATSVGKAESQYQELREFEDNIQDLDHEIDALHLHSMKHHRLEREFRQLAQLKCPPLLLDADGVELVLDELMSADRQVQRESARSTALESLASPPEMEDVSALSHTALALADAAQRLRRWSGRSTAAKDLKPPPALGDTTPIQQTIGNLYSAQLTNTAIARQKRLLGSLSEPPDMEDPAPLTALVSQLESTLGAVDRHQRVIADAIVKTRELEADLHAAERAGSSSFATGGVERRPRRRILVGVAGLASIAAIVVLFIFGLSWFRGLKSGSSDSAIKETDPTTRVVANANDSRTTGRLSASHQPTEKQTLRADSEQEPEKQALKTEKETRKEEPKPAEPKKEDPGDAKQRRLKQIRQLLSDAEMANEKGRYLDAILGFGQAALLYPEDLAEVESPEKIRLKFVDALKRYQAEVERALQKAAEKQPGEN